MPTWAELVRSGVGHAISATVIALLAVAGTVLVGWTTATDPESSWTGAARVGAAVWLLGHHADIALGLPVADGGAGPQPVSLTPLGLTALLAAIHVRSGRRLARLAVVWRGSAAALAVAVVAGAVTSGLLGLVTATWAAGPGVDLDPLAAASAVTAVAGLATAAGVASHAWSRVLGRLPRLVARPIGRWGPAGTVAVVSWVLGASLVVLTAQVSGLTETADRTGALATGPVGGVFLLLLQVALVPTVVLWAAALLAGPGIVVGGQPVSLSGSTVSEVPGLPLLTVLGPAGEYPMWAWGGVLAAVAGGAAAAWWIHRRRTTRTTSVTDRVADALAVGTMAGAVAAVLAWAGGGAVAGWGPVTIDPLRTAAAVAAETAVGALLAGVTLHLLDGRPVLVRPRGLRRHAGSGDGRLDR
ncbi:MAG: DUF6350 family protein [Kineosporiaceae bacterium]